MTIKAKRLYRRSGIKTCDICHRECQLVRHHIEGREIRNAEYEFNVTDICPLCHDSIHTDPPKIVLEGWFMTSEGRELMWYRKGEKKPNFGSDKIPPKY